MIVCRSPAEIERMRAANELVARRAGRTARDGGARRDHGDLDAWRSSGYATAGAEPAFKGYHGYPATMCASVNEQVVHGIPSARRCVEGDIISIDMGAKLDGFFGDCAVTVPVGRVPARRRRCCG